MAEVPKVTDTDVEVGADDISSAQTDEEHSVKENLEESGTTEDDSAPNQEIIENAENAEEQNIIQQDDKVEEVTADHPEVQQMVEKAMRIAQEQGRTGPGKCLLNRLYMLNKQEMNSIILQRLEKERARKLQEEKEARKEQEEIMRLQLEQKKRQEEMQDPLEHIEKPQDSSDQPMPDTEHTDLASPKDMSQPSLEDIEPPQQPDQQVEPEQEIVLPEVPDGGFPDVPEDWHLLEPVFSDASLLNVTHLEMANKSPEALLQEAVTAMEKPFQYQGWEVTSQDIDEEAEDMQAELGAEEQEMEGEEEEENEEAKEDEEVISEKKHYGDSKHFCPVAIKDNFILQPGLQDNAALYREKTYYCSSPEARNAFLQNLENYVVHKEPLQAPPLRVHLIVTGGTGKTANARWLANKLGLFHIQFQERLQEIMLSKLEKKVGLHHEEESIEEEMTDEAMLLLLENGNAEESKKEESKDLKEEVVLTVEEEDIKSYLTDNEPLPTEVMDEVVTEWWTKEPCQ